MKIRLAVGRIGDHIGASGDQLFAVDLVTADCLLDPRSLRTLLGKPIEVNHDGVPYGFVTAVDSELVNGVLHCHAELTNKELIEYMVAAKKSNLVLETSPTFTTDIELDSAGRRVQKNRVYQGLSILTRGVPGRGGSDVRVLYKYGVPMDELIQKIDALSGAIDAMASMLREHYEVKPEESGDEVEMAAEQYAAGVEDGKAIASCEYSMKSRLKAKGLEFKAAESVEEILRANLPSLGVATEGKSLAYMAAAFDLLPMSSGVETAPKESAPAKGNKLTVKFGKGK